MNADGFVYICPFSSVKQVIRGWGTEWRVWNKQGNKDGRITGSADSLGGDYEFTNLPETWPPAAWVKQVLGPSRVGFVRPTQYMT